MAKLVAEEKLIGKGKLVAKLAKGRDSGEQSHAVSRQKSLVRFVIGTLLRTLLRDQAAL